MSEVLDEHSAYLSDTVRIRAYERAIRAVVRRGDVVLDLAAGTGILGLLACRAGASRVYAVDVGGILGVARALARANGVADRITHVRAMSTDAVLPEPVDVIVCDQIGRFGFEAGLLEYIADARSRLLRRGGRIIPATVTLMIAPVRWPVGWREVEFWTPPRYGLDLRPGREIALNTGRAAAFSADSVLARPAAITVLDTRRGRPEPTSGSVSFRIARGGTVHGLGAWFSAELAPGVRMTNSPLSRRRITRRQTFFPLERPAGVRTGDRIDVEMRILPADHVVSWHVAVRRAGERGARATSALSTFRGMLFSPENLDRTRPTFRPALTPRAHARRTVLELCDGRRRLDAIERAVWRKHRPLFRSLEDAQLFVAEVVTAYAR